MSYQGPQDWQPQAPQPQYGQQPPYGYSQPGYPQPGYGPGGYPAPPGYPTPLGYPGYPTPTRAPKVSVVWTGAVLALAGLLIAIGSFMTWVRTSVAGAGASIAGTDGTRDGNLTAVFGVGLLVLGILIAVKQGRLWVSIVGIVLASITVLVALADIGDVSNRNDDLHGFVQLDVGPGLVLVLVAALAALAAAIVAICVRRVRQ